ncbi:30 kDa heat shock protein [Penicillium longicatenatum]|nr:30 kDa heat shock protein [Penicillium longicatenatum]
MSFLTCASDLSPLFQLLDNYDKHERRQTRPTRRTFTPAFDVRELADAYYLDGELPGVSQENIDIEFSDPTTLVIKGHTVRDYKDTEPAAEPQESSPRWHQPTVEDEDEDSDSNSDSSASVISANSATSAKSAASTKSTTIPAQAQPSKFHYWASERSIGEFQRTFTFSTRVNQDAVRASLRNGILSVVVPKETAPKPKKIRIQ